MRLRLLLAALFFCCISCSFAKEVKQRVLAPNRRRRGRKTAREGKMPEKTGHNEASILVDSYKSPQEPKPDYSVVSGKTGQCIFQGIAMFDKTVWSPKPCVTCICSGGEVVCDEIKCPFLRCRLKFQPIGECCPVCIDPVYDVSENSGDSAVPNDLNVPDAAIPQLHPPTDATLRLDKQREEEERHRKKDAERRRRKKQKKEAERQRKELEEKREQEKAEEEERRRRMEEHRRAEEELRRKLEMEQRELLRVLQEEQNGGTEEEQEEEVWLRGDVFQMPSLRPTPVSFPPLPQPGLAGEEEENEGGGGEEEEEEEEEGSERISYSLPPGCTISDVIVSCENAKLTSIPPLSIPELKSLNLQGNAITTIPGEAFNGVPNLEWIDLGKNKIISNGIDPQAFNKLKFLTRLYMDGNLLEKIPQRLPSTLQELKINENNLEVIEEDRLQGLSSLVILELEGNLLSEGTVNPKAFAPLKQLNYLRMGRNLFRTIPQGLPSSLLELHLESNLIEEISDGAFNQSTNLNLVVLRHNKLDESRIAPLAWINQRNLESIDLSHNKLHLVPSFLPTSLVHLVLVGNRIERIPGYVFAHLDPGLEYLYLSYNKLDGDGVEPESFYGTFSTMTELCLDHNQLIGVPSGVNEMTSLHFLRLNNNNIRHIVEDSICDPLNEDDSHIVALRLENNLIDPRKIPPTAFSCVRSYSSVVLKPQRIK